MIQVVISRCSDPTGSDCGVKILLFVDLEEREESAACPELHQLEQLGVVLREIITLHLLEGVSGGMAPPPITSEDDLSRVRAAWEEGNATQELNLAPLKPNQDGRGSWLTGNILTSYVTLRRVRLPSTRVLLSSDFLILVLREKAKIDAGESTWTSSKLEKWFRKSRREDAEGSRVDRVYVPVNFTEWHWGMLAFDLESRTLKIYDGTTTPAQETFEKYAEHVAATTECLSHLLHGNALLTSNKDAVDNMFRKVRLAALDALFHTHENADFCLDGRRATSMLPAVPAHKEEDSIYTSEELKSRLQTAGKYDAMDGVVRQEAKKMRNLVCEMVKKRCDDSADFAHLLAERYRGENPQFEFSDEAAVQLYVEGTRGGAQGGEVELEEMSRALNRSIILFEHPVEGGFRARTHIGKYRAGAPLFLLRTGLGKLGQHWQVLVPAGSDTLYVKELDAAMALVKVHPLRIVLPLGPDLLPFFIFAMPGDGHCVYTSSGFAALMINTDFQPGGCNYAEEWHRFLPPVPDSVSQATKIHSICWKSTSTARSNDNHGEGDNAFGSTPPATAVRLQQARRLGWERIFQVALPLTLVQDMAECCGAIAFSVEQIHQPSGLRWSSKRSKGCTKLNRPFMMTRVSLLSGGIICASSIRSHKRPKT
jgi:hypothetical protein